MNEQEQKEHAQQLADALIKAVVDKNQEVVVNILSGIFKPLMERLEHIGVAQVALANGLRQVRRDRNATEFAKVMLDRQLASGGPPDTNQIHLIADTAYAVANDMEVHALAAEVQAASLKERMEKHAKEKPNHDAGALALSFLKRSDPQ